MKKILFSIFLLSSSLLFSQEQNTNYARVKIFLSPEKSIQDLATLGIAIDHGEHIEKRFFISDFSNYEIEKLREAGFEYNIEIEDVSAWYTLPNREEISLRNLEDCEQGTAIDKYPVPENFQLGSMAGFYTWQEMLLILDEMHEKFPELISVKTPIEGELSIEGRPIHWVRISNNPSVDGDKPEVLYTALHHAREPNSLSQMIYYMWYLLENYESDPQLQFLINNTEMYFVPCVNPDGYVYNQTTNPEGGGGWRKNRRDNDDNTHGVDLNRNYDFHWGFDDNGSSPDTQSGVYRGTEGFSEPETRAIRNFCNNHEFQITLNYHTHGDLLIYPWGYLDTPTADNATFSSIGEILTIDNQYTVGTGTETVGYVVNGDSDDWMYGETDSKPAIFSLTPEVGAGAGGGFWPPPSQIIPNNKNTMLMNINAAALLHNYGLLKENNASFFESNESNFSYQLKRVGLKEGTLTVSLAPLSSNIVSVGDEKMYNLNPNEQIEDFIPFTLSNDIQEGETLSFLLSISNGIYETQDTIYKEYISSTPIFADTADDLNNWQNNGSEWNSTTSSFYSTPSSITDSPDGNYGSNINTLISSENAIVLDGNYDKALLYFWAKWDIEKAYDYTQVSLSVNGGAYFPLCGKYSSIGTDNQDEGMPLYDGTQSDWVQEEIDISEFVQIGDNIKIEFSMVSDGFLQKDGFYFDDLEIYLLDSEATASTELSIKKGVKYEIHPNPANTFATLAVENKYNLKDEVVLEMYNMIGQKVLEKEVGDEMKTKLDLDINNWKSGVYFYNLRVNGKVLPLMRFVLIRG